MPESIGINKEQCARLAKKISPMHFRPEHLARPFLSFSADRETKLRVYLFSVAICHQTHTLINRKKNLKGWLFIEDVFAELGKNNSPLLDPIYLAEFRTDELAENLKFLFSDDNDPAHCTLDRLEERADFMIKTARTLLDNYDGKLENMLNASGGYLFNDGNGIYELLAEFEVFSDPGRKKSTLFIKLAHNAGFLELNDPELIEPAIDYHIQRLLLRTGCVEVNDHDLKNSLQNKLLIDSDELVRQAAFEAVKLITKGSGKDLFEMDEILWTIGRSCCNEKMLCQAGECNKKPCTFFQTFELTEHGRCLFDGICLGQSDEECRKYWQPIVKTSYY